MSVEAHTAVVFDQHGWRIGEWRTKRCADLSRVPLSCARAPRRRRRINLGLRTSLHIPSERPDIMPSRPGLRSLTNLAACKAGTKQKLSPNSNEPMPSRIVASPTKRHARGTANYPKPRHAELEGVSPEAPGPFRPRSLCSCTSRLLTCDAVTDQWQSGRRVIGIPFGTSVAVPTSGKRCLRAV